MVIIKMLLIILKDVIRILIEMMFIMKIFILVMMELFIEGEFVFVLIKLLFFILV